MTDSLDVSARSNVGRQREHNEDTVQVDALDEGWLLVVADGMGGHAAGDVASEAAAETFVDAVTDAVAGNDGGNTEAGSQANDDANVAGTDDVDGNAESESTGRPTPQSAMAEGVQRAQTHLADLAAEDPGREDMGTTLVAALVTDDGAVTVVNVGDSRAYLIDDGIEQLTTDQTLVRELVEEGTIDPEDAADHPHRHVLAQALGTSDDVDPAFVETTLDDGTLLLCSDGLTEEVPDDRIREIVEGATDLEAATEALIDRANANGGSDNVSVVLATPA